MFLHLATALYDVLNLHFVTRQSAALAPVAARAVHDEVVWEVWAGDRGAQEGFR